MSGPSLVATQQLFLAVIGRHGKEQPAGHAEEYDTTRSDRAPVQ
jgi:hypothetical protein